MRFSYKNLVVYGVSGVTVLSLVYIWIIAQHESSQPLHHTTPPTPSRNISIVELMGSRDFGEAVLAGQNTTIMQPSQASDGIRHFALCLVASAAERLEERQAVRNTWGRIAVQLDVQVYFAIGIQPLKNGLLLKNLTMEQHLYDDLIVEDFEDSYFRLSAKMLRILKWYSATFSEVTRPLFLIKTDDDVFVKLPIIVEILKESAYYKHFEASNPVNFILADPDSPDSYYIGGKKYVNATIDPKVNSKFHLTSEEQEALDWKGPLYPPYVSGGFYILSGNVVKEIYKASFEVPIFPFEDAFITGMLACEKLGFHSTDIAKVWLTGNSLWPWKMTQSLVVLHPANRTIMFEVCANYDPCRDFDSGGNDCRHPAALQLFLAFSLLLFLIYSFDNLFTSML